jgi:hypothetical protein
MTIDKKAPLAKQVGIVVFLALAAMVWFGISQGWFSLANRSGQVEAPTTSVSESAGTEREQVQKSDSIDAVKESKAANVE